MIYSNSPLNLNLIIPFKDNKEPRRKLYLRELVVFRQELELRGAELKVGFDENFKGKSKLSISSRSDGGVKRYYWRFTSNLKKRTFNRLSDPDLRDYLTLDFDREGILGLKKIEEELIYINGNMKMVRNIESTLDRFDEEIGNLVELKAPNS